MNSSWKQQKAGQRKTWGSRSGQHVSWEIRKLTKSTTEFKSRKTGNTSQHFVKTKPKTTTKITNYLIFGKPALTNAIHQVSGKCHTWTQVSYNLTEGATKRDVKKCKLYIYSEKYRNIAEEKFKINC